MRPEGEEFVEADGRLVAAPQVHHQPPDQRARHTTNQQAAGNRPEHIDREPAPAAGAQVVQAEQAEAQHHERKSGAVVQAALAREAEAHTVAITRLAQLDIGGQHRVGGRKNRPEQDGRAQRQAEPYHPDGGDQRHRDRHRHAGEPQWQTPALVRQGQSELETHCE